MLHAIADLLIQYMKSSSGCLFHRATGLYCPGCGGTRALYLFLTGQFAASLRFHPLVAYFFFGMAALAILYAISLGKHKKITPKPFIIWLWGALIILILNVFIKNIALVGFGLDLLY